MIFRGAVKMSMARLFVKALQIAVLLCIFAFPACAEPIYYIARIDLQQGVSCYCIGSPVFPSVIVPES